ncbi:MAG TPA: hypothetical protein VGD98_25790 [Ktedonobacteraceae bacterium]
MKNSNSGQDNTENNEICPACGAPLRKPQVASALPSPTSQIITTTQIAKNTRRIQNPNLTNSSPSRLRPRSWLIGGISLLLIVGILIGCTFFNQKPPISTPTSTTNAREQTQAATNSVATARSQFYATATSEVQANTAATATANAQNPGPTSGFTNLENDGSQWGIFIDKNGHQGSATGTIANVSHPSLDSDQALEVSLTGGSPYVGVQAYRNLDPANTATTFDLSLSFHLPSNTNTTAPIQALEFTMNKWLNGERWEWAVQWEHIGAGITSQDTAFPWRLWTGSGWQNPGLSQQLATNTWHILHLKGEISAGHVHSIDFSSDGATEDLNQTQKFKPVQDAGTKLAVAVQLDGDSAADP